MEKELSAKDSRFKLGEEFKEDIQVKPDMSIQAKMKVNHDLEEIMSCDRCAEYSYSIHFFYPFLPGFIGTCDSKVKSRWIGSFRFYQCHMAMCLVALILYFKVNQFYLEKT